MTKSVKKRASDRIDIGLAIDHLRSAIVDLELVRSAGVHNESRQNIANARASTTAVLGTIVLLEGKARHEPH